MKRLRKMALLGWFMLWIGATDVTLAQWVSHGPDGGNILALAIDPQTPSTLYAGTEVGGVFKSSNSGASWEASGLMNLSVATLVIDPQTPSTLYTDGFKSTDGGRSWTNMGVATLAIDPQTPSTLYGRDYVGVLKSSNGGGSWTAINIGMTDSTANVLAIDPQTPATLYVGTDRGEVFKSTDGGGNWTAVSNGLSGAGIRTLAIDPQYPSTLYAGTDRGGVFKSSNGGGSWNSINHGLGYVGSLVIDPQNPATLYAGTNQGVFKSRDGGRSWNAINSGLTTTFVSTLAIDPKTPATLYAGTRDAIEWVGGVFKSSDGGASWSSINSGLTNSYVRALAIDPQTPATLYAGIYGTGVFKSSNGGGSWTAINTGMTNLLVNAMAIDPQTPSTLYAGTDTGIFKSSNGGGSWTAINTGLTYSGVHALAIDSQTPTTLYAGTDGGVFKSSDGGGNWRAVNTGLSGYVLAVDPQTPTTLYAGDQHWGFAGAYTGVFKSTNSGESWNSISNGLPGPIGRVFASDGVYALAIDPQTPATLYVVTYGYYQATSSYGGGLFKSIDGGGNWTPVLPDTPVALAIDPKTPSTLYAGMRGGIYKSSDGGESWTAINSGLTSLDVRALAIDPQNPSRIYAGTLGGGVFVNSMADCSNSVSPSNQSYSGSGIVSGHANVISAGGCGWTAASNDAWLTITSGRGGSGNGVVTFSVAPNTSPDSRTGTLTIAGETFTVTQTGLTSSFSIAGITPSSGPVTGGTSITLHGGGFQVGASVTIGGVPARISALTSDQMTLATGAESVPGTYDVVVTNPGGQSMVLTRGFTYTPVSGPQTGETLVPIVLSVGGMNGSFYTSELTLTNRGTGMATVNFTYTASMGSGSGTATDTLAAGQQKLVPDAISYLRSLGVPIPSSGSQGGTLEVVFTGLTSPADASVTVRTTTGVPEGRAGLAYGGVLSGSALTDPSYICGLRQNETDRSNLAIQNVGSPSEGNITLRLTVFSGAKGLRISKVLPDQVLGPGGFAQINGILASNGLELSNGYVRVERTNGTAPYYAYGVINDQANSDGSFIPPIPESALAGKTRMTLPVVVETELFSTELVISNWSSSKKTLNCRYVADAVQAADHAASFTLELEAGQQVIQPELVGWLRERHVAGIGPKGPTYAGALFVSAADNDLSGISVAARTSTAGGGEYGLFYTALPEGTTSQNEAWLYGMQQNSENRTNLALVNTGETDNSVDTFRIELFNGDTGAKVATVEGIALGANHWYQIGTILLQYAPGVTQGYARITRTAGNNPFIAYAVVNDGAHPGDRSGDGAFIASSP